MFKPNCLILTLSPEICLKSKQVRTFYEKFLKKNIIEYLKFDKIPYSQITILGARIYIFSEQTEKALKSLKNCFGIYKFTLAQENEISHFDELIDLGSEIGVEKLNGTFAVRAKSFDKDIKSKKIEELLGERILKKNPKLKVDLSKPKTQLNCILIGKKAYFYFEEIFGAKGMPIGTQGVVALIGQDKFEIKKIAFGLLKNGCRVLTVDNEINGLAKWNNCLELKDISLDEAKESHSQGRIKAFFCDAKNICEKEKIEEKIETKPFSPLFCISPITVFD